MRHYFFINVINFTFRCCPFLQPILIDRITNDFDFNVVLEFLATNKHQLRARFLRSTGNASTTNETCLKPKYTIMKYTKLCTCTTHSQSAFLTQLKLGLRSETSK